MKPTLSTVDLSLIALVVILSALRLFVVESEHVVITAVGLFKLGAHALVFGLIGAWLSSWYRLYLVLFVAFTIVEIVAFFVL